MLLEVQNAVVFKEDIEVAFLFCKVEGPDGEKGEEKLHERYNIINDLGGR